MTRSRCSRFGNFDSAAGGAYSGAADIGRGFAYFKLVIGAIISICLIIFGIKSFFTPDIWTQNVDFIVSSVKPHVTKDSSTGGQTIDYKLTGLVSSCKKMVTVNTYTNIVDVGQRLSDIYMRANCEGTDAVQSPMLNKTLGYWCIGIGIAIILFLAINMYFVNKFKGVAAVQGAGNIFSLFRR